MCRHSAFFNWLAASVPGLVGTVEIRTSSADFHGFHKPHILKAPFRLFPLKFLSLFIFCSLTAGRDARVKKPARFCEEIFLRGPPLHKRARIVYERRSRVVATHGMAGFSGL